jgi:hypothetical protein
VTSCPQSSHLWISSETESLAGTSSLSGSSSLQPLQCQLDPLDFFMHDSFSSSNSSLSNYSISQNDNCFSYNDSASIDFSPLIDELFGSDVNGSVAVNDPFSLYGTCSGRTPQSTGRFHA